MNLEKAIAKARWVHNVFAWLVIVGLGLEVIHIWNQPTSWREKALPLIADFLVFSGVFGETHYSGKASKLEEEQKKKLEKELLDSQLELARLQDKISPRALTIEQEIELQTLKGKILSAWVVPTYSSESLSFSIQISETLRRAEIDSRVSKAGLCLSGYGITIVLPDSVNEPLEHPLFLSFERAGITAFARSRKQFPIADLPTEVPVIVVGEKIISNQNFFIKKES